MKGMNAMSNHNEYQYFINLKATAWHNGQHSSFEVKGQVARALFALVNAKRDGCTALEVSSWAYRFSAYICVLRHDHKLDIQTIREEHAHGWHARYVLHTPVQIESVITA